jgi:hypothetical protein
VLAKTHPRLIHSRAGFRPAGNLANRRLFAPFAGLLDHQAVRRDASDQEYRDAEALQRDDTVDGQREDD